MLPVRRREVIEVRSVFASHGVSQKLDEGVQHHDDEPGEGDPHAPLQKLKAKLSLPAPPSKDANQ